MSNILLKSEEIEFLQNELDCLLYIDDQSYDPNKVVIVKIDRENGGDYGMIRKSWPIPKNKPIDKAYIIKKYNSITYQNDYTNLKVLFETLDIKGAIYYTSFGFSYDCFFKSASRMNSDTDCITNKLKELGIEFTNEFSDAHWVYRYRISKSKNNLKRIKSLTKNEYDILLVDND